MTITRMKTRNGYVSLIPLIVLCLFIISSSLWSAQTRTLKVGMLGDMEGLDPRTSIDAFSSTILYNVYEGLVSFKDDSLEVEPCLATSWQQSSDQKQWTYTLREGVTFHDGTPLTADVVISSFQKAPFLDAEIRKLDNMTVRFDLANGNSHFNDFLAQSYYEIVPPSAEKQNTAIGTGPFRFKEWVRGKKIVIQANQGWWKGSVRTGTVEFIIFKDQEELIQAVINQEIDLAEALSGEAVLKLRKYPYLQVQSTLGSNVAFLSINTEKGPLSNVLVRQAIAHAINVVDLTRTFFPGSSGAPATSVIPPTLFKGMVKASSYDPEEAKKLLKQSGVDLSRPIRLLEAWAPRPYMPDPHGIATGVKKYLEEVGFTIILEADPGNFFSRIKSGDVDLCLSGWVADNGDPVTFIASNLHSDAINHYNIARWSNPEFDRLLDTARVQSGIHLKFTLSNALKIVSEEVPVLPLFWGAKSAVWNRSVRGYQVHPSSQIILKNVTSTNE